MKPIFSKPFRSAAGLLTLLLSLAGCRAEGPGLPDDEPAAGLHSIAWVKGQCRGESTLIRSEIVVRGRIIANDAFGEWSRALVLADETGGITLYANAAELFARYPFGAGVVLYLNGLRLYDYGGKIVVGAGEPPAYGFGIPQELLASHLQRAADEATAPVPRTVALAAVGASEVDTYIRIEGVHFVEQGVAWCDRDPETGRLATTERTLADDDGHTLLVRTAASALYAEEPLPAGKGSVCGVVDCFNGKYTLRIVNREIDF